MSKSCTAGGAVGAGGYEYQHRVAAWFAVHILAEHGATLPWGLPSEVCLESFEAESRRQAVDDVVARTNRDGFVFAQVKRSVDLSRREESPLASAVGQFARQYASGVAGRQLDAALDRLLLITSPRCSDSVKLYLREALDSLRASPASTLLLETAGSARGREALQRVVEHAERAWPDAEEGPSEEDIRRALQFVYVQTLDVEDGGTDERFAKVLLRNAVLRDANQADAAWDRLTRSCADQAASRQSIDRAQLQELLSQGGFELRGTRSRWGDIERLRELTRETLALTEDLARIRCDADEVKIRRPCTDALRRCAEESSLLVVGDPGAGKSGVLHDLAHLLHSEARDIVFLSADRVAALGMDLAEAVRGWPPAQGKGFLLIDALDAARSSESTHELWRLMEIVTQQAPRWRLVASIRRYDLRHSLALQEAFEGEPCSQNATYRCDEFAAVRHFRVPAMQAEEWEVLKQQCPRLGNLVDESPAAFQKVLQNLFNLRLVAELISQGEAPADLAQIETQLELLDQYWLRRVIDDDRHGDDREAILRSAVERMVTTRTLRVPRSNVVQPGAGEFLHQILSRGVLKPCVAATTGEEVEFSHHILFDYACARLLFRVSASQLTMCLEHDPVLALTVRPSLRMHFQYVWRVSTPDRRAFWDLAEAVMGSDAVPEIAKLIAPSVAVEVADVMQDFEPLCSGLEGRDATRADIAAGLFGHVVGALMVLDAPLVGTQGGPWCGLLARVCGGRSLARVVGAAVTLLRNMCEQSADLTVPQTEAMGRAARNCFEHAMVQQPRNEWLVVGAIRAVCTAFAGDKVASARLLAQGLDLGSPYSPHELYWLAYEIEKLIDADPRLAEQVYDFTFREPVIQEGAPPRVMGRILALSFEPRQDWEMARYQLVNVFRHFLSQAPAHATRAAIRAVEAYDEERQHGEAEEVYEFEFRGRTARIRADHSHIWHRGHAEHDALALLGHLEDFLSGSGNEQPSDQQARDVVDEVVASNAMAVFWASLLKGGAHGPDTVGRLLYPLVWAVPVLTCEDTWSEVEEYIRRVYSEMGEDDRRRVEAAILGIPDASPAEVREYSERDRDALLAGLPVGLLVSAEAAAERRRIDAEAEVPTPRPRPGPARAWTEPFVWRDHLRETGVPVDEPQNNYILGLADSLKDYRELAAEVGAQPESIRTVMPRVRTLDEALGHAHEQGVHAEVLASGWDSLAEACARIVGVEDAQELEGEVNYARDVLLRASLQKHPEPRDDDNSGFDDSTGWGSPAARIEAAAGLMSIARHPTLVTDGVRQAILRLGLEDPRAAVRFQVSSRLLYLYHSDRDFMWKLIRRYTADEQSKGVLSGMVHGVLYRLAGPHMDEVAGLALAVFRRVTDGPRVRDLRANCSGLLFDLAVWREHSASCQFVEELLSSPADHPGTSVVIARLRRLLTLGSVESPDPAEESVRKRAWALCERLTRCLCDGWSDLVGRDRSGTGGEWTEDDQQRARRLIRLLDSMASQLYFASGTFDGGREPDEDKLTPEQEQRFYTESTTVVDLLLEVGYPSVTHHLLKMLEAFIPQDPRGVFLRVRHAVDAGQRGDYQFESMAADLIVKIVERYFAEYRGLIQVDDQCRKALLAVIDTFVRAGWPSARRLTYCLEDVFR